MMRAVVICEDHTLDAYILKPVVEQIFREINTAVKVLMVSDPRVRGFRQALDDALLSKVFANYPMADVFFLIVDRDCDEKRKDGRFSDRLKDAEDAGKSMFGCLAIEELEVWALALHRKDLSANWKDVRTERHPKEAYFHPFIKLKKWQLGLGKGRKTAMKDLSKQWDSLKALCPEVQALVDEVKVRLTAES